MKRVNLNSENLRNLIVNVLLADKWQVKIENGVILVSTRNIVGTEMTCSHINVSNKTVTLESHKSWNHISWKSIDPIRGAIKDFKIINRSL